MYVCFTRVPCHLVFTQCSLFPALDTNAEPTTGDVSSWSGSCLDQGVGSVPVNQYASLRQFEPDSDLYWTGLLQVQVFGKQIASGFKGKLNSFQSILKMAFVEHRRQTKFYCLK